MPVSSHVPDTELFVTFRYLDFTLNVL